MKSGAATGGQNSALHLPKQASQEFEGDGTLRSELPQTRALDCCVGDRPFADPERISLRTHLGGIPWQWRNGQDAALPQVAQ